LRIFRDDLMVQQQVLNSWEHMVGVIMLNQTSRRPVKSVLPKFLEKWPDADSAAMADVKEIEEIIRPLGMYRVRAKRLKRMSQDYLTWDHDNAKMLYGIGKYGSDSYEIFFKQNYAVEPTDKELKRYLEEEVYASSMD
jgi:methyl-CpG-binding domain protein 4